MSKSTAPTGKTKHIKNRAAYLVERMRARLRTTNRKALEARETLRSRDALDAIPTGDPGAYSSRDKARQAARLLGGKVERANGQWTVTGVTF